MGSSVSDMLATVKLLALPVALFFFGMGLVALARPPFIVGIFGATTPTPASRNEVRAVYGGYGLFAGATLTSACFFLQADIAHGVVLAFALSLAGMAFGRTVGALLERERAFHPTWTFVLVEALLAAMLYVATHLNR
jgi:hypothetical protein